MDIERGQRSRTSHATPAGGARRARHRIGGLLGALAAALLVPALMVLPAVSASAADASTDSGPGTLSVSPTHGFAGDSDRGYAGTPVKISGTCPAGDPLAVVEFQQVSNDPGGHDVSVSYDKSSGKFSATDTIGDLDATGPWEYRLLCYSVWDAKTPATNQIDTVKDVPFTIDPVTISYMVSPTSGPINTKVHVVGSGCPRNAPVSVSVTGRGAETFTTDGSGAFDVHATAYGPEIDTYPVVVSCGTGMVTTKSFTLTASQTSTATASSTSTSVATSTTTATSTHPSTAAPSTSAATSTAKDTTTAKTSASASAMASANTGTTTAGSSVTVTGSGFTPHEQVRIDLHSTDYRLATVTADASGRVSAPVHLPPGVTVGEHTITLTGLTSHREATVPLTILAAATDQSASTTPTATTASETTATVSLAYTGTRAIVLELALGLGLIGVGWWIVRRSPTARRHL